MASGNGGHPTASTIYRLAEKKDWPQIEKLWDRAKIPKFPTSFPEIVAARNGKILGFIAVRYDKQAVIIEPMIANSGFTYVHLIEAMENVLKLAGLKFYHFRLEPHRVKHLNILTKHGEGLVETLGYHEGFHWYRRAFSA